LSGLKKKAARGAVWSIVGFGGGLVIRFASSVILTRIFAPDVYGLMTLVYVFQTGIFLFADIGIRPSIVQSDRGDDPPFVNTAWTIQAGRGVALWIVAMLVAGPYAAFFNDDARLADLIPVTTLAFVIGGFNSTKLFSAHRHLAIGRVTVIELIGSAIQLAVTVIYAFSSPTVWAFVAGVLAYAFSKMVLSHAMLPGPRNRFFLENAAASALFKFGRWIFLSTALTFLAGQSDRLIFGKIMPLALLGIYSVGSQLATLPANAFTNLANTVTFPLYSRIAESGEDMQPVYSKARWMLMLLGGYAMAGLIGGGPSAVRLLYQEPYYEAGWIVQALSAGAWFTILESTNSAAILAKGHAAWNSAASVGKLVAMAALIPLGFERAGFVGAVLGYAGSDFVKYAVSTYFVRRCGLRAVRQDLSASAMIAGSAALALLAIRGMSLDPIRSSLESFASIAHHAVPALKPERAIAIVESIVDFVVVSIVWAPLGLPKVKRMIAERRRTQSAAELAQEA
jgi:O-antigen/teichoic acid export membrane protein